MRVLFTCVCLSLLLAAPAQRDRVMDSLQAVSRNMSDPAEAISALTQIAYRTYYQGNLRKGEEILAQAFELADTHHNEKGLAAAIAMKGTFFFYKNAYDSARACFERSLAMREKAGDKLGVLKTSGNLAALDLTIGDYKSALAQYEKCLKLEAELGLPEGSQVSMNNIAILYFRLNLYPQTLRYYRKAEKVSMETKNFSTLSTTYDGLASLYEALKKYDSSLYYINKSIELAEREHDQATLGYSYLNLALLYKNQQKPELALKAFNESLRRALLLRDKRLLLGVYGNLAALYIERNDFEGALVYLDKLVPIQEELQDKSFDADLAGVFAEYYFRKKDYRRAYEYMMRYNRNKDSVYAIENKLKITEMQEKYQAEKRERENRLLQVENQTHRSVRNYLLVILGIALLGIAGSVFAYRKIKHSNRLISEQKELVDEKQKEILDSIRYAKRIQYALLASDRLLKTHLGEHFVFFRPKDVVSGDFYWAIPSPEGFIYVTGDCTGHGVPGAFMSLLNITKLSEVIVEQNVWRPDLILNRVRMEIIRALNPEGSSEESRDGMDAVVCKLDRARMVLQYAAANNPLCIVRNGEIMHCKADKMPVGKSIDDDAPFTFNEIALEAGDMIYTFTDGFSDQFGGTLGKKFKYRQFEELLLAAHTHDMATQKKMLFDAFEHWKGELEQVDDVCVIGVRV